jgi:hypothetical protein
LTDPKTSIRLLKLEEPVVGDSDNLVAVRFQLIEVSLKTAPRYWALSYAWGNESATQLVYCNNKQLRITPNCAAALRQLASEPASRKHHLWVDAICIDQSSVQEKNHQVLLMSDIYSLAAHVIVWLGAGDSASANNITTLNTLATLARISPSLVSSLYRRMTESTTAASRAALPPGGARFFTLFPAHIFEDCDPFRAVLRASWHSRLWTLQEIVLARRATVRVGDKGMGWKKLDRLARVISAENAETGFTRYPGDSFMRVRVVSSLRGLLAKKKLPEQRYSLPRGHPLGRIRARVPREAEVGVASHVMMGAALLASDKRDKVYGQLAILQRHGVKLAEPDYARPLQEIYKDAARAIIEHESSLELLSFVSMERALPDLPSWVPDFGFAWFSWIPGSEFAAAAGESKAQYRFDDNGDLFLRAQRVDRIRRKTGSTSFFIQILKGTGLSSAAILELIRQLQSMVRFALDGSTAESLCMVLMQEIALSARSSREEWARLVKHVETWAKTIAEDIQFSSSSETPQATSPATETTPDAGRPPSADAEASNEDSPKAEPASDDEPIDPIAPLAPLIANLDRDPASVVIQHMAITRLDGNSLFLTESGRLGVATRHIQEGDYIYLVPGMRLPLVVREVEGGHRVIGSPFSDGMMRGELWKNGKGLVELTIV